MRKKQTSRTMRHRECQTGLTQRRPHQDTLIKMAKIKDKERILREKQQVTFKGTPIRLSADFLAETLQDKREWDDAFKVMKGKNLQPRILYPARLSFGFEGEIKNFTDK